MDEEKIRTMKVIELKAELDKKGLSKAGAKAALANRLIENLKSELAAQSGESTENGSATSTNNATADEEEGKQSTEAVMETDEITEEETPMTTEEADPSIEQEPSTDQDLATTDEKKEEKATTDKDVMGSEDPSSGLPLEPPSEELDYEEVDLKDDLVSFDIEDSDIAAVEQPVEPAPAEDKGGDSSARGGSSSGGPGSAATEKPGDEITVIAVKSGSSASTTEKKKAEEEGHPDILKMVWISNLTKETRALDLKTCFGLYGKVMSAKVVMNPSSKEAKCFGLVTMSNEKEAEECLKKLTGYKLHEKEIVVSRPKKDNAVLRKMRQQRPTGLRPRVKSPEEKSSSASKEGDTRRVVSGAGTISVNIKSDDRDKRRHRSPRKSPGGRRRSPPGRRRSPRRSPRRSSPSSRRRSPIRAPRRSPSPSRARRTPPRRSSPRRSDPVARRSSPRRSTPRKSPSRRSSPSRRTSPSARRSSPSRRVTSPRRSSPHRRSSSHRRSPAHRRPSPTRSSRTSPHRSSRSSPGRRSPKRARRSPDHHHSSSSHRPSHRSPPPSSNRDMELKILREQTAKQEQAIKALMKGNVTNIGDMLGESLTEKLATDLKAALVKQLQSTVKSISSTSSSSSARKDDMRSSSSAHSQRPPAPHPHPPVPAPPSALPAFNPLMVSHKEPHQEPPFNNNPVRSSSSAAVPVRRGGSGGYPPVAREEPSRSTRPPFSNVLPPSRPRENNYSTTPRDYRPDSYGRPPVVSAPIQGMPGGHSSIPHPVSQGGGHGGSNNNQITDLLKSLQGVKEMVNKQQQPSNNYSKIGGGGGGGGPPGKQQPPPQQQQYKPPQGANIPFTQPQFNLPGPMNIQPGNGPPMQWAPPPHFSTPNFMGNQQFRR